MLENIRRIVTGYDERLIVLLNEQPVIKGRMHLLLDANPL